MTWVKPVKPVYLWSIPKGKLKRLYDLCETSQNSVFMVDSKRQSVCMTWVKPVKPVYLWLIPKGKLKRLYDLVFLILLVPCGALA